MIIRGRAPLRLGLAGGGTDLASYAGVYGGCVLNATIDRYVYATLEESGSGQVKLEAGDIEMSESLPLTDEYPLEGPCKLHRAVYNHFIREYNDSRPVALNVHTFAECPAGSGLGTSSTIVVALCSVFARYFKVTLDEYELASLAFTLERNECGLAGGMQDQYTATFGGVNFMEFLPSGVVLVNSLRIKRSILNEFESSMLLYFTGVSRSSEAIIKTQSENVRKQSAREMDAMHALKEEAYAMKAGLLKGDFASIISSFKKGWEYKKRAANSISNPEIEDIYDKAMGQGALAGKISGAGGGGFMMFLVPPSRRSAVLKILAEAGGDFFPAHFTKTGAETWSR